VDLVNPLEFHLNILLDLNAKLWREEDHFKQTTGKYIVGVTVGLK
jgi:hypothetical protein